MENQDSWNAIEAALAGLPSHDADPAKVERLRVRGLAALAAQQRKSKFGIAGYRIWQKWYEPALTFSVCALYLIAAIGKSLALLR